MGLFFVKLCDYFCSNYFFRDLKDNNIMLTTKGQIRLIDFGYSRSLADGNMVLPRQTASFGAPEVSKGLPAGTESDLWSFGVIFVCILQQKKPFTSKLKDKKEREDEIRKAAATLSLCIDGITDRDALDLISKLLVVDPCQRLKNIPSHQFFKNVRVENFKVFRIKLKPITVKVSDVNISMNEKIGKQLQKAIRIPTVEYLKTFVKMNEWLNNFAPYRPPQLLVLQLIGIFN